MTAASTPAWSVRWFRVWLNLAAVVVVGLSIASLGVPRLSAFALACSVVALAAWVCWALLPTGRVRDAALVGGAVAAALGAPGTDAILVAAAIAAVLTFAGDADRPVLQAVLLTGGAALVVAAGAAVAGRPPQFTLASDAGVVIALLVGITRRQTRLAERRERELQERALASEREATRSRLLAERAAAARDIHDVLAHSLGGLVLQLDAVAALLEAGRTDEAGARIEQARRLAGDGLAEARRAVGALRDPDAAESRAVPDVALEELVTVHRSLGAEVEVEGDLGLGGIERAHREALVRAVQEALSNARRHSPGATTGLRIEGAGSARSFRIATPVTTGSVAPGGGHGLTGMRERFAALGDGSTVTAGVVDGEFVVAGRLEG